MVHGGRCTVHCSISHYLCRRADIADWRRWRRRRWAEGLFHFGVVEVGLIIECITSSVTAAQWTMGSVPVLVGTKLSFVEPGHRHPARRRSGSILSPGNHTGNEQWVTWEANHQLKVNKNTRWSIKTWQSTLDCSSGLSSPISVRFCSFSSQRNSARNRSKIFHIALITDHLNCEHKIKYQDFFS